MLVERINDAPGGPAPAASRYRITPDGGSTWQVEIARADGCYIWRVLTEAMDVESPTGYRTEEYALNAAVRYILDVEAGARPPE